ncbi:6099_t:CDS:2 [Paraglomus brasilianum]|uniref:6099_t:CDS:1 n=1 Tax=Paraglomus brasilianum TaxID=144538 RepID=A0A9N9BF57_9GLOM|nr:6099_t:CDS:2 [Paraglomus brasilianum]
MSGRGDITPRDIDTVSRYQEVISVSVELGNAHGQSTLGLCYDIIDDDYGASTYTMSSCTLFIVGLQSPFE